MDIRFEMISKNSDMIEKRIFQNEMKGIYVSCVKIKKDKEMRVAPEKIPVIFFFIHGRGMIHAGENSFEFNEKAAFCPVMDEQTVLKAYDSDVTVLKFSYDLIDADIDNRDEMVYSSPFFLEYSDSIKYGESIKSAKTVSRSIIPSGTVPRFSMGTVQTRGYDKVSPHIHDNVEQLFLGLDNNRCTVKIEDASVDFIEDMVIYIPMGKEHGLEVEHGADMNYLWVDFFVDRDMSHLSKNHFSIDNHQ